MSVIETKGLTHVYSQGTPLEFTALKQVDFSAEAGEFIGLIGHTGSGKSTLIQHLNGLLKPTEGKILFHDEDIYQDKQFTRRLRFKVGLVFQYPEYQLFEETVYKDIAFGPKNMGLSMVEINRRVHEAAEFVELPDSVLQMSPFDLSGGQKRRAAIAGVIAMEPEVLVLDEPTAGLDPSGRESLLSNIRTYRDQMNATIIMVSHSMEEVAETVDRLYVMDHGTIAMCGTPTEVFARAEELQPMGLAVPQITEVFTALRASGVQVPNVYTVDQAVAAIRAAKGGAAPC